MLLGDLNARTCNVSEVIKADINIPALNEFEEIFQRPDELVERKSCDTTLNSQGRD